MNEREHGPSPESPSATISEAATAANVGQRGPDRRSRKALRRSLTWGLTAVMFVLLVLAARKVDWHATWIVILSAHWGLLMLATALNLISLVAKALRWWLFLRPLGARSPWLALKGTFVGAALSNVAPANAGEAARVLLVSRTAGISSAGVLAALTLERLFEAAGFIVLLAGAPFFASNLPSEIEKLKYAAIALLVGLAAFLVFLMRRDVKAPKAATDNGRVARFRAYLSHFRSGLALAMTGQRMIAATLISAVSWGLQVVTYHLSARAVGLPVSVANTITLLLAENVGFLVRVTPGSVGVFQLIFATTAVAMDLPRDAAVAAAVLLQALQLLPVTVIGAVLAPNLIANYRAARRQAERAGVDTDPDQFAHPPRNSAASRV